MVQCPQPPWAHNGQNHVLSMTSQRIVASELVGSTAYCLPGLRNVQYPGGRGHFTGAFVSTKSRCTQSCMLAFPSRRLSANLEKLRRFSPSQSMPQTVTMDVQWPPQTTSNFRVVLMACEKYIQKCSSTSMAAGRGKGRMCAQVSCFLPSI